MQLLYRSIDTLQIGGYPFILRVMTDGDTVTVDFEQNPRSTAAVSSAEISVYYGSQAGSAYLGSRTGGTVNFAYDPDADHVTVSASAITFGGIDCGTIKSFQWSTVFGNPDPVMTFAVTGPDRLSTQAVQLGVDVPDGMYPAILGIWANEEKTYGWRVNEALTIEEKYGGNAWHLLDSSFAIGHRLMYTCVTAYYATPEGAAVKDSDYAAVAEMQSPIYTVSGNTEYFYPYDLTWSDPVRGCPTTIAWGTFTDFAGTYQLERSADGGDWELVYAGASNAFTEPAGAWQSVKYRVRSARGTYYSPWIEGAESEVGQSNVYIGVGGKPTPAAAMYIGMNGALTDAVPMFTVGAQA